MDDLILEKPVFLVGMMGTGKSTLGRQLAQALGRAFYDSDSLVEEKAGHSIAEIFEVFGEAKFRQAERNTIMELLDHEEVVVATGGGAVINSESLEVMRAKSVMIWLKASVDDLFARVQKSQDRPLLKTEDPKGTLAALLEQREHLYAQAHIHIDVNADDPMKTLDSMIKALCEYAKNDRL